MAVFRRSRTQTPTVRQLDSHMEIHMKKLLAIAVGIVVLLAAGMPMAQDAKAPASHHDATATQPGASTNMSGRDGSDGRTHEEDAGAA